MSSAPTIAIGSPAERFTRRMFSRIISAVARSLREHELSVAQLATLYLLDERGTIRISDVATELERSLPTASRLVDGLVRQGLVAREEDPHDRRARSLTLTKSGRAFVARSSEVRIATIFDVGTGYPDEAIRILLSIARAAKDQRRKGAAPRIANRD